jgi:hypothetical protein
MFLFESRSELMVRLIKTAFVAAAALIGATYAAETCAQEASAPRTENAMKACGDKWRAVREVESPKGVTWPQFLASCRAQMAGATTASPSRESTSNADRRPGAEASSIERPQRASRGDAGPVFPREVTAKHVGERPALARQRTCSDQFKANKASDANAGLKWIEKGGGYWSKCNAHLKQLRA